MEAEIRRTFPSANITLIKGGGGVFDVHLEGALLYSKQTIHCGQFPAEGVVTRLLQTALDD